MTLKMKKLIFYPGIMLFLFLGCFTSKNEVKFKSETQCYKRFCFENGACTDYRLYTFIHNKEKYEKKYETINIEKIDPNSSSDQEMIAQFILALDAHNITAIGKITFPLYRGWFFKKGNFKESYLQKSASDTIAYIRGIDSFERFDFRRKIIVKSENEKTIELAIKGYPEIKMIFEKEFYYSELRQKHINFLLEKSFVSPTNLGIKPIGM